MEQLKLGNCISKFYFFIIKTVVNALVSLNNFLENFLVNFKYPHYYSMFKFNISDNQPIN